MVCARPRFIGSDGWVRSNACTWVFSSNANTTARAARALQESAELFEVGGMSDRACYSGALAADAWKSAGAPERARMARRAGGDASRDRGDEPPAT